MTTPILLLTFANDRDRRLRNLPEEAKQLRTILEEPAFSLKYHPEIRENIRRDELLSLFQHSRNRNRIALFHFGGHAGDDHLLLDTPSGQGAPAYAAGFAAFLSHQENLHLLFLNGCSTAAQAQSLLAAGVKIVITTDSAIADTVAVEFATRFYTGLAGGATVQQAFDQAAADQRMALQSPSRAYKLVEEPEAPTPTAWPWTLATHPDYDHARRWRLKDLIRLSDPFAHSPLGTALLQLPLVGPQSFGVLIAKLLSALTGQNFQHAQGSYQLEQMGANQTQTATVIAVEGRPFLENLPLNVSEQLGEIQQRRINVPELSVWVIVAGQTVDEKLIQPLHEGAHRLDIHPIIISAVGKPSALEVLCAQAHEIITSHFQGRLSAVDLQNVTQSLDDVTKSPEFGAISQALRAQLSSPLIGFENWRREQNEWFRTHLQSEKTSRAAFKQVLNVSEPAASYVKRPDLQAALNDWWSKWYAEQSPFLILGNEGDGKTWGIASWLDRKIHEDPQFPPVLFVASLDTNSNVPRELITTISAVQGSIAPLDAWQQRLFHWLVNDSTHSPRMILILDGINERRSFGWWRQLFEGLLGDEDFQNVAIIVTCRTTYWQRERGSLLGLEATQFALQPFNDEELKIALVQNKVKASEIPPGVLELMRKPRYFDLTLKHRTRLQESGDLTPARLIYEDWLDRWTRKTELPISDQQFRSLLREIVEKYWSSGKAIKERELEALLPSTSDQQTLIEELRTGGVLTEKEGRYRVDERRLTLGLGLLLVEQLEESFETDPDCELSEVAARWLEPHTGMDIKARICEMAALHALQMQDVAQPIKSTLLLLWLESQNPGQEVEDTLTAYLPLNPDCYIQLAELVWGDDHGNLWAQDLLMHAYKYWYTKSDRVAAALKVAFTRWLAFVHTRGYPIQRYGDSEKSEEVKQEICDRLGFTPAPGSFTFAGRQLTAIESDGLLQLGRVALAVISTLPLAPFIPDIATACVAEAIMGSPEKDDLLRWLFSSSRAPVWTLVKHEVDRLLQIDTIINARAAYRLLSFEGSQQAYELQQNLPHNLFPPHPITEEIAKDPCASSFAWSRSDCEHCLQRQDLPAHYVARQISTHSLDPELVLPSELKARLSSLTEDISVTQIWSTSVTSKEDLAFDQFEPVLCAYAPDAAAELVRNIVRHLHERDSLALRQVSFRLREHTLLFEQAHIQSLYQVWEQLSQRAEPWSEEHNTAERFHFEVVMQDLDAAAQLEHLLKRPETASDLQLYKRYFRPIENWEQVRELLTQGQNECSLRRVLWFISAHAKVIPATLLEQQILPILDSDNSFVRSCALGLIRQAQNAEIAAIVVRRWTWHPEHHVEENHWGSLILSEYGQTLRFSAIRQRIDPVYLGYAVHCRGLNSTEVNLFAQELDGVWTHLQSLASGDLPRNFPPLAIDADNTQVGEIGPRDLLDLTNDYASHKTRFRYRHNSWGGASQQSFSDWKPPTTEQAYKREAHDRQLVAETLRQQADAGNVWFARRLYADALAEVVTLRPDLLEQWLDPLINEDANAARLLFLAHGFYESLCIVLLKCLPDRGLSLYSKLQSSPIVTRESRSRWRLLDIALFTAPPTNEMKALWADKLKQCKTDLALLHIASMAQRGTATDWLRSYIDQCLDSEIPFEKSLGMTLLGFDEGDAALKRLNGLSLNSPTSTWVGQLLQTSARRWNMNDWAKHWFQRFYTVEKSVDAWAAFRLFLRCVDSRFWIWEPSVQGQFLDHPDFQRRRQFVATNLEAIGNRIRKNEKSLEDHLYGQKVMHNQVWPWI